MITYLNYIVGKPDKVDTKPYQSNLSNKNSIIIFDVTGWSDATGHATLWHGMTCSDHGYFSQANKAYLWQLK